VRGEPKETTVRHPLAPILLLTAVLLAASPASAQTCAGMDLGPGADLNGFVPFPVSSLWNTDVSGMPVDPSSASILAYIGTTVTLHPDFGPGIYQGSTIGIPYQVEAGTQPKVGVTLKAYAGESDPGPMPIPLDALIEGYPQPGNGDRHVLVLEKDGCWLYELFGARLKNGVWSADSSAIWDMTIDARRPYTWTSADAAGAPIFPGLARYDEVAAGEIRHALRFTVPSTRQAFVLPATHWASSITNPSAPPMGTRMRLKASFDISGFSTTAQVILTALKKYGMILADNGSGIYISGAPDDRWSQDDLDELKSIQASSFEVVSLGTVYTPANVPTGSSPQITSFTANPRRVAPGQPVTLSWSAANAEYTIVSPSVGPVRGTSVVVNPQATTTYTLYTTNEFGRTTAIVRVTVR
jgi:hypothetical protein